MDITNHAKERYVERIKNIKDKQEIKRYLAIEEERIIKEINKLYEFSEHIYRGQVGGDKTTKNFFIHKDICLVADESCIRTIYRINFAFPEHIRLTVIEGLKEEIKCLQDNIELEESSLANEDKQIDSMINQLEGEIKALQVDIENRKETIEQYQATRRANRGTLRKLNTFLQNYAEQLLGNTQYKKDII